MSVQNSLAPKTQPKFSVAVQGEGYKKLINNTLGDAKLAQRFTSSVLSAVAVNPALQECDASTILSAAFLGESLKLSPSPQLGQYYMVPFKDKKNNRSVATFVLGWKGYVQLAIRSGYYKKINVLPIKQGELISWNPMTEDIEVNLIKDDSEREKTPDMGYYAMFEYSNGFRKAIYWSLEKMQIHADTYSPAFHIDLYNKFVAGEVPKSDLWKCSSFWYKSFGDMACKTMLRQLISKWGIMSIELQQAYEADDTFATKTDYSDKQYLEDTIEANGAEEPEPEAASEEPIADSEIPFADDDEDRFAGTPFAD